MLGVPSECAGVVATIDPDAYTAATYTSDWVDMENYEQVLAIVMAGELGSSATLNAKLQQATDGSGTDAKDITGKAITALTQAGSDSNKQALINVRADELDVTNSFTHVALVMTVGTATSDAGAVLLGFQAHYDTANASDLASVDEIVT